MLDAEKRMARNPVSRATSSSEGSERKVTDALMMTAACRKHILLDQHPAKGTSTLTTRQALAVSMSIGPAVCSPLSSSKLWWRVRVMKI